MRFPVGYQCDECAAILREMHDAREVDRNVMRQRLVEAARSSGRKPGEMWKTWVWSVIEMPDDEMQTVIRAHNPRAAEVEGKRRRHEAATGHSVRLHGFHGLHGRDPRGYY